MRTLGVTESAVRGRCRVLLVDDQVAVREMLGRVLDGTGDFEVVAMAGTGREGLEEFRRLRPEMVVAGLALREMSGPEMFLAMREEGEGVRRVFFSGTRNRVLLATGLRCGAHGFVHKTEPLQVLLDVLAAVVAGRTAFGAFATEVADELARGNGRGTELAPRLRLVLQLIAEGHSTKQIAGRLELSPKTVDNYRSRLMASLGVRDVASLTRHALQSGLVE